MGSPAWRAANIDKVRGYWRAYYYRKREQGCGGPSTEEGGSSGMVTDLSVGEAVRWGWTVRRLREEIGKCEVLCANCHRKRHWEQHEHPQGVRQN